MCGKLELYKDNNDIQKGCHFMLNEELFTKALNLEYPWKVTKVYLEQGTNIFDGKLHVYIDYTDKSTLKCPVDSNDQDVEFYDFKERTWRHLNFWQYEKFIHAKVTRVKCPKHGIKQIEVPWSRKGSGFTLLKESMIVTLAQYMPVLDVGKIVDEFDTRLWRVIFYYVCKARGFEVYGNVKKLGVDETSVKGHKYITVVVDTEYNKVICVTEGKDIEAMKQFSLDFIEHKGDLQNIQTTTCDMSPTFNSYIKTNMPNATIIIDKFHVIKYFNESIDLLRKEECKHNSSLKKSRYLFLKNETSLSQEQISKRNDLLKLNPKTCAAFSARVEMQRVYDECKTRAEAEESIFTLTGMMIKSQIQLLHNLALQIIDHMDKITSYFEFRYTNAILEGINSMIQNCKTRARGFKNLKYFKSIVYLVCGKLNFHKVFGNEQMSISY